MPETWIVLKRLATHGAVTGWRQAAGRNFPSRESAREWVSNQPDGATQYRLQRVADTDDAEGEIVRVAGCSTGSFFSIL